MFGYYLIARITYVDCLSYSRDTCKIKVEYRTKQLNMLAAMHTVLTKFYTEHESSDIISIDIIENTLY